MATKKPGGMTWLETIELKPDLVEVYNNLAWLSCDRSCNR